MWLTALIVYVIAYLLLGYLYGSIPFGYILSKLFGYGDIRNVGSGNIGATNVLRTGNKHLAFLTLLFDAAKAAVPIYLVYYLGFTHLIPIEPTHAPFPQPVYGSRDAEVTRALLFALGAILGHCFPIWLKFKGGKGVATALGALLAAVPFAGLAAAGAWIVTAVLFKISSLAALVAVGIAPIVTFFVYGGAPATVCLMITLLVWFRHKDNIKRLMAGTEPKIGAK